MSKKRVRPPYCTVCSLAHQTTQKGEEKEKRIRAALFPNNKHAPSSSSAFYFFLVFANLPAPSDILFIFQHFHNATPLFAFDESILQTLAITSDLLIQIALRDQCFSHVRCKILKLGVISCLLHILSQSTMKLTSTRNALKCIKVERV